MYCRNCGKQLPDGSSFCRYCGAAQTRAAVQAPRPTHEAAPSPARPKGTKKIGLIVAAVALVAAVIAAAMAKDGAEMTRLIDDLPPFAKEKRRVEIASGARAMREMARSAEFAAELTGGLRFKTGLGWAMVAPDFEGKSLILRAEAEDKTRAAELTRELERRVRKLT